MGALLEVPGCRHQFSARISVKKGLHKGIGVGAVEQQALGAERRLNQVAYLRRFAAHQVRATVAWARQSSRPRYLPSSALTTPAT